MSQNNDQEYWQRRFEAMHEANLQMGDEFYKRVEDLYREAIDEIEKDLAKWYARLKANNEVNLREAKRMLKNDELEEFKWTLEQYIKAAKENGISADWSKQLENTSAKFHITRLQALEMQIRQHLEYLYGNYLEGMYEAMQETYQDSFYNTAYELQIGTKAGFEVNQIDTKTLEKVLANPWAADDINFSERIHKDKTKLVNNLQTELVQSIIRGTPQDKIVKSFANRMNISLHNAGRLIATESAYFATLGEKDSMTNLGVQQYEILATLDSRTSDICRHMDGKIFDMKDFKVGITAPPLHVWCRSCTIPHIGEKLLGSKRAARDGDDGKTYYVDGNMKYEDWKKVFVDKSMSYKSWQDTQKNGTIKETKPSGKSEWDNISNWASDDKGHIIPTQVIDRKIHYRTPVQNTPNAVVKYYTGAQKDEINYDLYDVSGKLIGQINWTDHNNPKAHNFGKVGEHKHIINWIKGKMQRGKGEALSDADYQLFEE